MLQHCSSNLTSKANGVPCSHRNATNESTARNYILYPGIMQKQNNISNPNTGGQQLNPSDSGSKGQRLQLPNCSPFLQYRTNSRNDFTKLIPLKILNKCNPPTRFESLSNRTPKPNRFAWSIPVSPHRVNLVSVWKNIRRA